MTPNSSLTLCTVTLIVLGSMVGAAEKKEKQPDALAMRLSATISPTSGNVIVRARVEPDARSRELTIEWVADDLSGGLHAISLEGARAAATHHYTLKNMAPGQYVVTAILRLDDGTEVRRASTLQVIGLGSSDGAGTRAAQGSLGGSLRPASEH